uniref:Putative secreted protein n=1 Tax=Anopheles marajoara TaxID=58244 RepID=A0A2M4C7S7_9DIPT
MVTLMFSRCFSCRVDSLLPLLLVIASGNNILPVNAATPRSNPSNLVRLPWLSGSLVTRGTMRVHGLLSSLLMHACQRIWLSRLVSLLHYPTTTTTTTTTTRTRFVVFLVAS